MVKIKICGIRNSDEALAAVQAGADALGFVFAESRRKVSIEQVRAILKVLPPFISTVGVFVNEEADRVREIASLTDLTHLQFQGEESPDYCAGFSQRVIKAFSIKDQAILARVKNYPASAYLLDSHVPGQRGGTGRILNWDWLKEFQTDRPIILAGGLNPDNVARAVNLVNPYAVDVSSGVEDENGFKDSQKMTAFVKSVKG